MDFYLIFIEQTERSDTILRYSAVRNSIVLRFAVSGFKVSDRLELRGIDDDFEISKIFSSVKREHL